MYKNEVEKKGKIKKSFGSACRVLGVFQFLFVCLSDCGFFFPITTITAAVDECTAKMCRHTVGSRMSQSHSGVFHSTQAEVSRAERGRAGLSQPRAHVLTVHVALGMLWPQNEFGQLT